MHVLCSTKLDADKRLALQQEKEALETKLLEVYVYIVYIHVISLAHLFVYSPKMKARLAELRAVAER